MAAITRVWGKVDGVDYDFPYNEETQTYEVTVPKVRNGYYVMEIHAADDAGNEAYMATIVATIDLRTLKATFRVIDIAAPLLRNQVDTACSIRDIQTLLVATGPNER